MAKYHQGRYNVKIPNKYSGDPTEIRFHINSVVRKIREYLSTQLQATVLSYTKYLYRYHYGNKSSKMFNM